MDGVVSGGLRFGCFAGLVVGDVDGSFEQFAFEHVRVGLLKEPDIRAPIRSLITLELMPAFSAAVRIRVAQIMERDP